MRYDRELIQATLKAMKRVGEIRARREHAFWKNRCVFAAVRCPRSLTVFAVWQPVEQSFSLNAERRSWRNRAPSNWFNLWLLFQWRTLRRGSRRRSGCPQRRKALLYQEKVDPWVWRSTDLGVVFYRVFPFVLTFFASSLTLYDIMYSIYTAI